MSAAMSLTNNCVTELAELLAGAVMSLIHHDLDTASQVILRRLDRLTTRCQKSSEAQILRRTYLGLQYAAAMKTGDYARAVSCAREAVTLSGPGTPEHHVCVGELMLALCRQGDRSSALNVLAKSIRSALSGCYGLPQLADLFSLLTKEQPKPEELACIKEDLGKLARAVGLPQDICVALDRSCLKAFEDACRRRK